MSDMFKAYTGTYIDILHPSYFFPTLGLKRLVERDTCCSHTAIDGSQHFRRLSERVR